MMAVTPAVGQKTGCTPPVTAVLYYVLPHVLMRVVLIVCAAHSNYTGWVVLQYMNLALHQINDQLIKCKLYNTTASLNHGHNNTIDKYRRR